MALLVSAKGSDLLAWRACGDFTVTFRQLLLDRLEFCRSDEAEALLMTTGQALDNLIAANDAFCARSTDLIGEASAQTEPSRLRGLVTVFFAGLYEHVDIHHSAPAFYEFSTLFLQALSGSISRYAHTALGQLDRQMPQVELIALGAAGRQEFSPFCPLQLLLVHGEAGAAEQEALSRLGHLIHEGFEACGLLVDGNVTPCNPEWRGSMSQWRQRLELQMEPGRTTGLTDLFRLADQSVLCHDEGFEPEFSMMCRSILKEHRSTMAFQVTRVLNLSHGIGIMGGMRLEKKGLYRRQFALRDNALRPLSAAISVLALLKGLEAPSTPQRIREILWRHELNVDMAERLLQAWHNLHELRLTRECTVQPDWSNEAPLHLNVEEMPDSEKNLLRESLETVGAIQRHVGQTFSGMEE
jgi:signal-transduction protein with cAMP-binding, CBS, and nucleotidyltransferase domain